VEKVSLMVIKKDCMGCHACEVACKQEHGLGAGPRLIRVMEKGPDFLPLYCHHCAKAPCKGACPVGAITRNNWGIVRIHEELCIGCKACVEACPFGAMQFDDERGLAAKCDLCAERIGQGRTTTACSAVCPTGCILFGGTQEVMEKVLQGVP
jgi:Fe-S-cluster-containing dehydrogenase component